MICHPPTHLSTSLLDHYQDQFLIMTSSLQYPMFIQPSNPCVVSSNTCHGLMVIWQYFLAWDWGPECVNRWYHGKSSLRMDVLMEMVGRETIWRWRERLVLGEGFWLALSSLGRRGLEGPSALILLFVLFLYIYFFHCLDGFHELSSFLQSAKLLP